MKIKILTFALLTMISSISHAVVVNFSGEIRDFNPGPFSGGDLFTGSFTLDESVTASGANNRFSSAVNSFVLNINDNSFTAEGGDVVQNKDVIDDYLLITMGDTSTTGQIGDFFFTGGRFEFDGENLFSDPTILANNLTKNDFTQIRYLFGFSSDTQTDNTIGFYGNITDFNFEASVVPVPAAAWLFGSALLGFIGFGRRKNKI